MAQLPDGPFTYAQGLGAGLTPRQLRFKPLITPFPGIRSIGSVRNVVELAVIYSVGLSAGQHFSHTTAAVLHGLRMPERWNEKVLHVTSLSPQRAPRGRFVVGHQSSSGVPSSAAGLPATDPVTTWLDCAELLTVDDLIVMGDGLICRKRPVANSEQLRAVVESRRGRRGYRKLVAALDEIRARTDSARETVLRLTVVRAGFPEPELNPPIYDVSGELIAHGDLTYPEFRTILEYEGEQHATDPRQFAIDIARIDRLMEEDWRVIRVDKRLMAQRPVLFRKLTKALVAGGWRAPSVAT